MFQTSALKLEILTAGVLGILLIGAPILLTYTTNNDIELFLDFSKDNSSLLMVVLIAIVYPLGFILNAIGFGITDHAFARRIKKNVFKQDYENYEEIKSIVLKGDDNWTMRLESYHNMIRLTRSIILSFLFSSILFFYFAFPISIGFICLSISLLLLFQLNSISNRYYKGIYTTYKNKKSEYTNE